MSQRKFELLLERELREIRGDDRHLGPWGAVTRRVSSTTRSSRPAKAGKRSATSARRSSGC